MVVEAAGRKVGTTTFAVLVALSVSHLLNDTIQSLIAAVYPVLKESYGLSFTQIGLITLAFQCTASLLQPLVGQYTDRRPQPFSLVLGMGVTLAGLLLLSVADASRPSCSRPRSSASARPCSTPRRPGWPGWRPAAGTGWPSPCSRSAGNGGSALGPLLAAFVVVPWGQRSLAWFSVAAVAAMLVLARVGMWYRDHLAERAARKAVAAASPVSPRRVAFAVGILLCLIFSKYFYLASLTSYYTFYLIDTFGVGVADAQLRLFVFLGAVAAGTFLGGPVGDRIGFKAVIWGSILGVLPFTLALPYVGLFWTTVLTVPIGLILASAFSAIMVYAQELMPSRVGMVAGLFFGFAFGMGGVGAAVLGWLADQTSIGFVYRVCAFLPLIGLLTAFLPNLRRPA